MDKKKILYFVRYPLDEGFHLKQKFDGQLNAFANLGFDVSYIGFDRKHFYLVHGSEKSVIGNTHFRIPNYVHTFLYHDYYTVASKTLEKLNFDFVYYRNCAAWPSTVKFANQIKKQKIKLLYEVPTYLANTKEKSQSFLRSVYNKISNSWEKKLIGVSDLILLIGDPAPHLFHGKPAMSIFNGISLQAMPARKPVNDENCIHLLALSSMCEWHGYDRLILSLANYRGDAKVQIHMVGKNDGGCLEKWKNLAKEQGLEEQVIFHGSMYGTDLDQMFDLCDVGINSLGMYRKGIDSTSELKTREYIARGLPFVRSVRDEMIDELDQDLYMTVANDDSIPSMEEIVAFAQKMRQDDSAAMRLRKYASEKMTWESQYKKVFDFVEENRNK